MAFWQKKHGFRDFRVSVIIYCPYCVWWYRKRQSWLLKAPLVLKVIYSVTQKTLVSCLFFVFHV